MRRDRGASWRTLNSKEPGTRPGELNQSGKGGAILSIVHTWFSQWFVLRRPGGSREWAGGSAGGRGEIGTVGKNGNGGFTLKTPSDCGGEVSGFDDIWKAAKGNLGGERHPLCTEHG